MSFTFEARARGPKGTRTVTFQTEGFDAYDIVSAEAEKHLQPDETLTSITRLVNPEAQDMSDAHAEGLHADLPREGCPDCEQQGGGRR